MIKKNLKTMIITSIIILLPIVLGVMLWDQLPEQIATHFNANGVPDGWSSKGFAVVGLPILLVVVHWLCVAITGADPKKKNISDKMMTLVFWLCPMVSLVSSGAMYMYTLDSTINQKKLGMLFMGCIFVVIGNYMPKMKQSYTLGIKLPWTLESEENWNRTHRFAGYAFMIGGIVVIVAGLLETMWLAFATLLLISVITTIYSYVLYKKGI